MPWALLHIYETVWWMYGGNTRDLVAYKVNKFSWNSRGKSLAQTGFTVLSTIDTFSHQVENDSLGCNIHVDFSKDSCNGRLTIYLKRIYILAVLYPSDENAICMMSDLFWAIDDRKLQLDIGNVLLLGPLYVDMMYCILEESMLFCWDGIRFQKCCSAQ